MEWSRTEYLTSIMILAVLVAPFLAFYLYGKIEDRRRAYERKLDIFKVLMTTRATPLAAAYVQSLNRIFVEFTKPKEKKVREAWATLLDHFNRAPIPPVAPQTDQPPADHTKYVQDRQVYNSAQTQWNERTRDFEITLLKEMGSIFKYDFDEVTIRNAAYYPRGHGDLEFEQRFFLQIANDVLSGRRLLGVHVANLPEQYRERHTKSPSELLLGNSHEQPHAK